MILGRVIFHHVAVGDAAVGQLDFVMSPLVVVFVGLMPKKVSASKSVQAWKNLNLPNSRTLQAAQASSVVMAESASSTRIERAQRDIQPAVRPHAGRAPTRSRM